MKRREFIVLVGGAAAWPPIATKAQVTKGDKPFRIATLPDFGPVTRPIYYDAMRELGLIEGRDFIIEQSGFEFGGSELSDAARRVVAAKPDIIVTITTGYALALRRETTKIPIVTLSCGYPIEAGLANSLASPGKNVTGNSLYAGTEVWGKLLELLREVKPGINRVSVLWTYLPPNFPQEEIAPCYAELRNAGRSLGLAVHIVEAADIDHVQAALTEVIVARSEGLLLTSGLPINTQSSIMQFAVNNRLPTIAEISWPNVEPLPLLSYGPVYTDLVRSAVASVDKIMKGAKAGDLPFQLPAKFKLQISLKTAKALGLAIPPTLLAQADEVIE